MVMVMSLLPTFGTIASAETISGSCGSGVTYTFDKETGLFTVSRSGIMDPFPWGQDNTRPWYSYIEDIKKVVIEEGITSIGQYCFKGCTNLTEISFSSTVNRIEGNAFSDCTSLTKVVIPNVTQLAGAFTDCTSLKTFVAGGAITYLTSYLFYNCTALETVIFGNFGTPHGTIDEASKVFINCSNLKSIYFGCTKEYYEELGFSLVPDGVASYFSDTATMVKFVVDSGNCSEKFVIPNSEGKLSELPVPTKNNCIFVGWYDARKGGKQITTDTVFTETTVIFAQWTAVPKHEAEFTGVCDKEYTIVVEMKDYLPPDAIITSIGATLPTVGSNYNITTSGIKYSKVTLYTKVCDEAASDTFVITVNTSNYGVITIHLNITLLGFKINSYDDTEKSASVSFKEAGTYSVIFASYNEGRLLGIDVVDYKVEEGGTFDVSQEDTSFTANKIMLWSNVSSLIPLCSMYKS